MGNLTSGVDPTWPLQILLQRKLIFFLWFVFFCISIAQKEYIIDTLLLWWHNVRRKCPKLCLYDYRELAKPHLTIFLRPNLPLHCRPAGVPKCSGASGRCGWPGRRRRWPDWPGCFAPLSRYWPHSLSYWLNIISNPTGLKGKNKKVSWVASP